MKKTINIAGFKTRLYKMPDRQLRNIPVDVDVRFDFAQGEFKGLMLCFLSAKKDAAIPTPSICRKTADRIKGDVTGTVVFLFDSLPFYQRQRMIEQGVYFVVSGKYANLPNLFVNAVESAKPSKQNGKLSPVAQYILLYYLQHPDCNFHNIGNIEAVTPFSYLQISRAVTDLEHFGLCKADYRPGKGKELVFDSDRRRLWNGALPFMKSPVKRTCFTDTELNNRGAISGVNGIAHYTSLSPVRKNTLAFDKKKLIEVTKSLTTNPIEGATEIEEWQYPPTITGTEYADPLSLYLSMRESTNPRVEDALEQLIENIKW
ncbi:MAG: hypothetical protein J6C81_01230 [Muribaculaceae bacterium]|nr:hypothetical protein [Muribaculaceae bacterium]